MNLHLALELAKRDIKTRYSGSVFGVWWSFIWPAVMIFIYTVIFSQVLGAKLPQLSIKYSYGVYLATGLLPWTTFANTLSRLTTVFVDNKYILTKIPIELSTLILSVILSELFSFLVSFSILIVILFLLKAKLSATGFLIFIVSFTIQEIFVAALGILTSIITVFIRDLKEIVNIVLQIWFWITPIVYTSNIVPKRFQLFLKLNPLYYTTEGFHQLIYPEPYLPKELVLLGILSVFLFVISFKFLKVTETDIRDFS